MTWLAASNVTKTAASSASREASVVARLSVVSCSVAASVSSVSAVAAAGPLNPKEFADVRATDAKLKDLAAETGGGLWWLGDKADNMPSLRMVRAGHDAAGSGWFGLRRNEQYLVNAVHQVPLT